MRLLLMNDPTVSWIKKDPIVSSMFPMGKILGRGSFSVAYENLERETIIKVTADPAAYRYVCGFSGHQFTPQLHHNFGEVGEYLGRYPVYLFEQERLMPLTKSARKSVSTAIAKAFKINSKNPDLAFSSGEVTIPGLSSNGFDAIYRSRVREGFACDYKPNNFMCRKSGEIVLVDPWYCHKTMAAMTLSVAYRKY